MSEMIDATSHDFPGFFVIAALTRAKAVGGAITGDLVEVSFTVNGVELPFAETLNDIYQRMERGINHKVQERAEKLIAEAGLDRLTEALREAEEAVTVAVKAALSKAVR